jgi:DNA polymerase-1
MPPRMPISRCGCGRRFKPQLHRAAVTTVYETLERPLVPVLAEMEMARHQGRPRHAQPHVQRLQPEDGRARGRDHELAGESSTSARPSSWARSCSTRWACPAARSGKTGAYSTGADVLEDLATEHDLPARVLDWRQLSKLKSTYTDALQDHINPETGRVHTSYSIAGASPGGWPRPIRTCRTSRSAPRKAAASARPLSPRGAMCWSRSTTARSNCASSPISPTSRAETGLPRRAGHPRHDRVRDVRRAAGRDDARCPPPRQGDQFRRDLRHLGLWPGAQPAHSARAEAQGFIDRYFERFPGIRTYMDDTKAFAKEHGLSRRCSAARSTRPRSTPRARARALPIAPRSTRRSRAPPPTSSAAR